MRLETDKLVKILLKNGMAIHMYADDETIARVRGDQKFVQFKDDGNDSICLSMEAIAGFEVLDERTDSPQDAEAINPSMPELPKEEK